MPMIEWADAPTQQPSPLAGLKREEVFDKHYFNGGGRVNNGIAIGGYAREGYSDFPVHWATFGHVMARKPESVLELGCARGYIIKRLQDVGIRAVGLEISKHCYMTRACDGITSWDMCSVPWPIVDQGPNFDLAFSIAVFEHVPEDFLPGVFAELKRTTKRGLHGIDFGKADDGFDKSHCSLHLQEWWRKRFDAAGLQAHEVVDKEDLEKFPGGKFPPEVLDAGGLNKINIGSFTQMFHHGWSNIDVHDLGNFAKANGYNYLRHDVRQGLPFQTGTVDAIFSSHVLEHFTYEDGLKLLKECRRVIKPNGGAMRLLVPDANKLIGMYVNPMQHHELDEMGEINDGVSIAPTRLAKMWALLNSGHHAGYDWPTLQHALQESGWKPFKVNFRESIVGAMGERIVRECTESHPILTLAVEAVPLVG